MKKIIFLTQYDERGASTRIRIYQFLPFFRSQFQVVMRPLISRDGQKFLNDLAVERNFFRLVILLMKVLLNFLKRYFHVIEAWRYDVVVVQKDVLPFGLLWLLKFGQKNIIFEFDDAIWLGHQSAGKQEYIQKIIVFLRKMYLIRMLKTAKKVIVDNSFLANFSREFCSDVLVISAPIDTDLYKVSRSSFIPELISFIWIGSPGTSYLLEGLMPFLIKLSEKKKFKLINVGGLILHSEHFLIDNVPWSIDNELKSLSVAQIGLMPLDDIPFNQGRLGYKIVQYFSAGLPTLATNIGLNSEVIQPNINGLLYEINNEEDFVAKAYSLIDDTQKTLKMGENARKIAEDSYDLSKLSTVFSQTIKSLF